MFEKLKKGLADKEFLKKMLKRDKYNYRDFAYLWNYT